MAGNLDLRAHAHELKHVHEAVFKNAFFHDAGPFGKAHECHKLGLHVCGKAGVGLGFYIRAAQGPSATRQHALGGVGDLHAHAAQFENNGFKVFERTVAQHQLAAGNAGSHEKSSRLNAVGHNGVFPIVQGGNTLNADDGRAVPLDFCTAGPQKVCEVNNFWLAGGVFKHGLAISQSCGHEQVFRAAHCGHVKRYVRALELAAAANDITFLKLKAGAHLLQTLEVLVYGARANGAAAGQGDARLTDAGQQRAEAQNRGAHGAHQVIWSFRQ